MIDTAHKLIGKHPQLFQMAYSILLQGRSHVCPTSDVDALTLSFLKGFLKGLIQKQAIIGELQELTNVVIQQHTVFQG